MAQGLKIRGIELHRKARIGFDRSTHRARMKKFFSETRAKTTVPHYFTMTRDPEGGAHDLEKFAFSEVFSKRQRHRNRWGKMIAIILFAVAAAPAAWAIFSKDWRVRAFWFIPAGFGLFLLKWLSLYSKGSPCCPNCHQDVTNCRAVYCHFCGEFRKARACSRCGTEQDGALDSSVMISQKRILYCPGCGVLLNTLFYRYEAEGPI
jgi:hypothetical protein